MKHHVTKGSVFDDLGFSSAEAISLKMRAELMREMENEIIKKRFTQLKTKKFLNETQTR